MVLVPHLAAGWAGGELAAHHLTVVDGVLGWGLHGGVVAAHDLTGLNFLLGFPAPHGCVRLFIASELIWMEWGVLGISLSCW